MGRSHLCEQAVPKDPAHLLPRTCAPGRPSGLSLGFPRLSPSRRQLDYVLLARPPRYSPCGFRVRLACLIHAANVRSEPGSNPSLGRSCSGVAPIGPKTVGWLRCHRRFRASTTLSTIRSHASLSRPPGMSKITPHRPSPACEGREKVATCRRSSSSCTIFFVRRHKPLDCSRLRRTARRASAAAD
jgi:hypothetical protein